MRERNGNAKIPRGGARRNEVGVMLFAAGDVLSQEEIFGEVPE